VPISWVIGVTHPPYQRSIRSHALREVVVVLDSSAYCTAVAAGRPFEASDSKVRTSVETPWGSA
jgi:hypothetical protein